MEPSLAKKKGLRQRNPPRAALALDGQPAGPTQAGGLTYGIRGQESGATRPTSEERKYAARSKGSVKLRWSWADRTRASRESRVHSNQAMQYPVIRSMILNLRMIIRRGQPGCRCSGWGDDQQEKRGQHGESSATAIPHIMYSTMYSVTGEQGPCATCEHVFLCFVGCVLVLLHWRMGGGHCDPCWPKMAIDEKSQGPRAGCVRMQQAAVGEERTGDLGLGSGLLGSRQLWQLPTAAPTTLLELYWSYPCGSGCIGLIGRAVQAQST